MSHGRCVRSCYFALCLSLCFSAVLLRRVFRLVSCLGGYSRFVSCSGGYSRFVSCSGGYSRRSFVCLLLYSAGILLFHSIPLCDYVDRAWLYYIFTKLIYNFPMSVLFIAQSVFFLLPSVHRGHRRGSLSPRWLRWRWHCRLSWKFSLISLIIFHIICIIF